ncbi:MAG: aldo/keto reductase [Candidatus Sumerlaeota bacterium]|nr:aldo/keto reductase [Candidatus Sumerlaeota bacterium]
MLFRNLGSSGIQASVVGLGAWAIGGWMWGGCEEDDAIRAIHASLDSGVNLIDTAPAYGFGHSEEIVGKALRDRRDQVVLATKCGLIWDRVAGLFHFHSDEKGRTRQPSKLQIYRYLHPDSIRQEIERSLRRLATDRIDLYQCHWTDPTTPLADTLGALLKLKEEGKIRAIGVSNAGMDTLGAGAGAIDTDQEKFSMLDRAVEQRGQLEFCLRNNIAVLAYSPMALGLLTGEIGPEREFREGDLRRDHPRFTKENRIRVRAMLDQMRPIAERLKATLGQLVIAWTFSQSGLTHVLCGARNGDQARSNAQAGRLRLTPEDIAAINRILDPVQPLQD